MAVRKQEHTSPQPTHPPQAIHISSASPLFFHPTHGPIRSNGGETRKRAKRKTLWRHQWEWRERSRGWPGWWKPELTGGVTLGAPCSESSWTGMTLPHTGSNIQWVMNARNWTLTHTHTRLANSHAPPTRAHNACHANALPPVQKHDCVPLLAAGGKTWMCMTARGNCTRLDLQNF